MKTKIFLTTNVLLVLALLLAACAAPATQAPAPAATQAPAVTEAPAATVAAGCEDPVNLNVIIEQVPDYDIVAELTKQFETENPNIKVTFDAMPYDAMRDKILTSFLAPKGTYDIIIVDNPWMDEFPAANFLTDLNSYIANTPGYNFEDFVGPVRELTTQDGKITAVPYYNYALGLIVRQDLFDDPDMQQKFQAKYNRPLAAPKTLDEYLELGKFFKENGIDGAAMQPQRGYKILEEWKNWLYAEGGDLMDASGKATANSDAAKSALNKYIDMYKNAAPANSLNWGFDDALRSMASGESATMMSYNWMLPTLNKVGGQAGDLAGKFQLYPVPGGKAVLGAWYWAIPQNAACKDAAWKYISWLTSPAIDKQRVIKGGAPVRASVMSDPEVWQKGYGENYYKTVLQILSNTEPLARGVHADEISNEVGTFLSSAVAGEMSVEDALKAIDAKITEINSK
jgi:ABC-type glycerol-3-phosphate transport system substrate-binding protein